MVSKFCGSMVDLERSLVISLEMKIPSMRFFWMNVLVCHLVVDVGNKGNLPDQVHSSFL